MRRDFTQGDSTLIYLAAHVLVLGRPIVIIPQRANTGGQGEIGTPALWDVPIFLKPTPNDS
jgi:hypothetical protein